MNEVVSHEDFIQSVVNHLKERSGCPVIVIVKLPEGLEIQVNFRDFAMQMGMLDIAKMTTAMNFEQAAREALNSGANQLLVSNIEDAINSKKKKPN